MTGTNMPPAVEELVQRLRSTSLHAVSREAPRWIQEGINQQTITTASILGSGLTSIGLPVALQGLVRVLLSQGDREAFLGLLAHTLLAPAVQPSCQLTVTQGVPRLRPLERAEDRPRGTFTDLWQKLSPTAVVAAFVRAALTWEARRWNEGVRVFPGPLTTLQFAYKGMDYAGWRFAPRLFERIAGVWELVPNSQSLDVVLESTTSGAIETLSTSSRVARLYAGLSADAKPGALGLVESVNALAWAAELLGEAEVAPAVGAWLRCLEVEMNALGDRESRQLTGVEFGQTKSDDADLVRSLLVREPDELPSDPVDAWVRVIAIPIMGQATLAHDVDQRGPMPHVVSAVLASYSP